MIITKTIPCFYLNNTWHYLLCVFRELHSKVYPDYKYKPRRKSAPVRTDSQPTTAPASGYSDIVSTTEGCIDLSIKGPNQHISSAPISQSSRSSIQNCASSDEKRTPLPRK